MRRLVVLTALAFSCSGNSLPLENSSAANGSNGGATNGTNGSSTNGGGTNGGMTTGGTNGGGTNGGMTTGGMTTGGTTSGMSTGTNGGTTGGGGPGDACKTACDCILGLACFQNQCVKSPMGELYCCDDPSTCPTGQFCQGSDGMFGSCDNAGGGTTGMSNGCMTACDCPDGQACFMGSCFQPPQGNLYCCDNNMCPNGGFCQASDGSFMMCGGGGPGTTGGGGNNGGSNGTMNMCNQTKCMADDECTKAGCTNGCSRRRGVCR